MHRHERRVCTYTWVARTGRGKACTGPVVGGVDRREKSPSEEFEQQRGREIARQDNGGVCTEIQLARQKERRDVFHSVEIQKTKQKKDEEFL